MEKTAVGLFSSPELADKVVRELEAGGLARQDIRVIGEPLGISEPGSMSIAHTDFEVDLIRDLKSIGAGEDDAECYAQGLKRGGAIVLAVVSDEKADAAVDIMNRHHAIEIEELKVLAPHLPLGHASMSHGHEADVQYGRVRSSASGGARLFFW